MFLITFFKSATLTLRWFRSVPTQSVLQKEHKSFVSTSSFEKEIFFSWYFELCAAIAIISNSDQRLNVFFFAYWETHSDHLSLSLSLFFSLSSSSLSLSLYFSLSLSLSHIHSLSSFFTSFCILEISSSFFRMSSPFGSFGFLCNLVPLLHCAPHHQPGLLP